MNVARWSGLATLALSLCAGACASAARAGGPAQIAVKSAPSEDGPAIQVLNRHWQDINVFLLLGGTRYRLGTVGTTHTERFRIGRFAGWDTQSMRIFVDPIGSNDTYTSEAFNLGTGQWADCVVEGNLSLSSYMVRNY